MFSPFFFLNLEYLHRKAFLPNQVCSYIPTASYSSHSHIPDKDNTSHNSSPTIPLYICILLVFCSIPFLCGTFSNKSLSITDKKLICWVFVKSFKVLTCLAEDSGISWITLALQGFLTVTMYATRQDLTLLAGPSSPTDTAFAIAWHVAVASGSVAIVSTNRYNQNNLECY